MSRLSRPAIASALSRTNSASSRRGDCDGEQPVVRVDVAQLGPEPRVLPVGRRHDHQPDHVLDVPAALAELDGQPVEQLGMDRPLALRAEVLDQAADARCRRTASRAG